MSMTIDAASNTNAYIANTIDMAEVIAIFKLSKITLIKYLIII